EPTPTVLYPRQSVRHEPIEEGAHALALLTRLDTAHERGDRRRSAAIRIARGGQVAEHLHDAATPHAVRALPGALGADRLGGLARQEAWSRSAELGDHALLAAGTGEADARAVVHESRVPACGLASREEALSHHEHR